MTEFPKNAYGISSEGHNPAPSGSTGNGNSTNQIDEGEEQPLFWSRSLQKFVDWITLKTNRVDGREPLDDERSQKIREDDEFRARVGFKRTID